MIISFQAQESPEPVYDLSECALKNVPSGVYSRCKVMRKEGLLLQVSGESIQTYVFYNLAS